MKYNSAEYQRQWRKKHPEKAKEIQKRYYIKNKEKILENQRIYKYKKLLAQGITPRIYYDLPQDLVCAFITGKTSTERGREDCD